jgi:hypothetical protein
MSLQYIKTALYLHYTIAIVVHNLTVIGVEQVETRCSEHRVCCACLVVEYHCLFNSEVAQIIYHRTLGWLVSDGLEKMVVKAAIAWFWVLYRHWAGVAEKTNLGNSRVWKGIWIRDLPNPKQEYWPLDEGVRLIFMLLYAVRWPRQNYDFIVGDG